jgi:hypothetical protein
MTTSDDNQKLLKVYEELCQTYRAIDDFRAKLLGLLPLASIGGVFLLLSNADKIQSAKEYLLPLGLFGFVVTLGLFAYELFGIERCHFLLMSGENLEREILKGQASVCNGQFINRPHALWRFVNEPIATGIIYPAVLAGWWLLAFGTSNTSIIMAKIIPIAIFALGFIILFRYNLALSKEKRAKNLPRRSRELM